MSRVDDAIAERVAFSKEQSSPNDDPRLNESFRHQVADSTETERRFCELEALELYREVNGRQA